jgi:putative phage-type endonuclease
MAIKMIQLPSRDEWLKHRQKYIGGSEASAVIGKNPYMSNTELFDIKTGKTIPENISSKPYVQFGIAAEPLLRELFKITYPQYEMGYVDNNSWINDKYPYAACSLDGWLTEKATGRKGIWEGKTCEIVSSMHKEKWNNRIPDNYYIQLIHNFNVCEDCEFAKLTALLTFKFDEVEVYQQIKHYHIERSDVEADIRYLAEEERRFYQNIKTGRKPNLILPDL